MLITTHSFLIRVNKEKRARKARMVRLDVRYSMHLNSVLIFLPPILIKSLNLLMKYSLVIFIIPNLRGNVDPKDKVERQERKDLR